MEDDTPSAPVLSRSSSSLGGPASDELPTSSHGNRGNTSFRKSLLDKELPALPRYLIPAPLYACNPTAPSELETEQSEDEFEEPDDDERLDSFSIHFQQKARSHFSTWSNDSIAYSSPISENQDDEIVFSPALSSLTSNDSDIDTSQGLLIRYSYTEPQDASDASNRISQLVPEIQHTTITDDEDDEDDEAEDSESSYRLSTPPQLDELRISTFGSDLFSSEQPPPPLPEPLFSDASSRRSSRRQAACFGLGFQYTLPDDETTGKTTLADSNTHAERIMHQRNISVHRESAMSRLDALMDDFAFLGDAVI